MEGAPGVEPPPIVADLLVRLRADRRVDAVEPVGSRADGTETPISDWDFRAEGDPGALLDALPSVACSMQPLACFWDPLVDHAALMVIFPGPVKVDLITGACNPARRAAHAVPPDTPREIDMHFWDWTLWLASKVLAGRNELVASELQKMHATLLAPIGVARPPSRLAVAVQQYRAWARDREIDPALGAEVERALREHGLLAEHDDGGAD